MSLGGGFVQNKVGMFVLRAITGIGVCTSFYYGKILTNTHYQGGALTIPSALNLIVQLFPEPQEQGRAIAMFGASGAIGNGALFGTRQEYRF
jgi:MFS family permease